MPAQELSYIVFEGLWLCAIPAPALQAGGPKRLATSSVPSSASRDPQHNPLTLVATSTSPNGTHLWDCSCPLPTSRHDGNGYAHFSEFGPDLDGENTCANIPAWFHAMSPSADNHLRTGDDSFLLGTADRMPRPWDVILESILTSFELWARRSDTAPSQPSMTAATPECCGGLL